MSVAPVPPSPDRPRSVTILGATGSVGRSTLTMLELALATASPPRSLGACR